MSAEPDQQAIGSLTRRIHEAALKAGRCMPADLFYLYPPGIAARILRSGISVEEIETDGPEVLILSSDGEIHICTTSGIVPTSGIDR